MSAPERPGPPEPADDPFGGSAAARGGPAADPLDRLGALGASWKWVLGSALATLVFGILMLVWPDKTLHLVAVLIGLYLLVAGVFRFVAAFAGSHEAGERAAGLLAAVVYVVAGVLCLRGPQLTITVLALVIGMVWLASGMLGAYAAVANRALPHRGLAFALALLGIVAGIVVLCLPIESAVALTRLLGLWLILLGLAEAAAAFALRSALRH
ncbi:HdeD family acid-resistance protein [Streptomyces toxytricini]|uniref:HdeD family acid-resistance protein n=1 Tax=Streptomyces toxytricini TaxID=67369 RepID=A0ABW8EL80_STRT5